MKDTREATYILGIKIYRDRSKRLLKLSQSTYIYKILKQFSMEESKRGYLPISYRIYLSKDMYLKIKIKIDRIKMIPYTLGIRSIMYVMLSIRLDVTYVLIITNKYQFDPCESH